MELPIYNATISDSMDGIFAVSLVEYPAVESNFIAFSKDDSKTRVNFAIEDEEKHNILGCVLRADYPIYRVGEQGEEYYIKFSKEVIEKMAEKMLTDHTFNYIDLNHDCFDTPNGVTMRQLFVKDVANGVNPIGFEDVEDGSLFALYHVDSMDLWQRIKDGEFKGFSVEAWLSLTKIEMQKQNNKSNNNKSFFMNIKEKLAKLLATFGAVSTDKGDLMWEGDADLKEGDAVTRDNGDAVEDGEYTTEDGKVITVKEGKVETIVDAEAEVAEDEPKVDEVEAKKQTKCEDEKEDEEAPKKEDEEEPKKEEEKAEDEDSFDAKAEIEALKAEIEALKAQIAEIVAEPKADPIVEEFEAVNKNKKQNKAALLASYLNK